VKHTRAPDVVVRRLALYLRVLGEVAADGVDRFISSRELGDRAGVSPAQVRKDLAFFGEFGKQGVGYEVRVLQQELQGILNVDREIRVGLAGVGELGTALARYLYRRFHHDGAYAFHLVASFDVDPDKVGRPVEGDIMVYHMDELHDVVRRLGLEIFILAVPAGAAQAVADACVAAGVRAILNFAPVKLRVPPGVRLHISDVSLELQQLAYYL